MSLDLEGLNERQREAVTCPGGPLLVLAGAGSGKTRVLTLRIAWLLQQGALRPWEILAVTFTNKAAGEMKQRVASLLGPDADSLWVSTFHSTCLRILRREATLLDGYDRDFVIYDQRDSLDLLKRVMKEAKVPKTVNPKAVRAAIDRAKNDALSPAELEAARWSDVPAQTAALYRRYQERLRAAGAMDFGDLLLNTLRLFERDDSVRDRYRGRFTHMLVDEYQDTNHVQYRLVKALADHGPRNVCVVGDEDQSIYSFRGADIRNILDFERDFPGAQVVRLEQNYRSSELILKAATAVVERNTERKGKRLWTAREGGQPIRLEVCADDREEARRAVQIVHGELGRGQRPRDIAVFYRTNAQSRALEEEFLASGLPFALVGGQRFYDRKEVKDALAWLKVLANPADEVSLLRIINEPPRGIGARSIDRLGDRAARAGTTRWEALRAAAEDSAWPARSRKALAAFRDLVDELRGLSVTTPLPDLLVQVLERSGTVARLEGEGTVESEGRLANLNELHAATVDFVRNGAGSGLAAFLDRVSLVADTDKLADVEADQDGRVTLMTVHSAKGLEYPVVLVVGMDEGLFPHARASTFARELEEERRLAYVAITRAEDRLYLLRARRRPGRSGMYEAATPSRFLRDLPLELIAGAVAMRDRAPGRPRPQPEIPGDSYVEYDSTGPSRFERVAARRRHPAVAPGVRRTPPPAAPAQEDQEPRYVVDGDEAASLVAVGCRVYHTDFGEGEIRQLEGPPDNLRATVFFRRHGSRRLFLRHAALEILSSN